MNRGLHAAQHRTGSPHDPDAAAAGEERPSGSGTPGERLDPSRSRVAVFVSGRGRTLANLIERIDRGDLDASIRVVIASKECGGAEIARRAGLPTIVLRDFESAGHVERVLREHGAEWAILAGYVRYLPIPNAWAGRIVNIHPALLPKFGGPGMYGDRVHRAVLDAGETESGCTVHLVDEEYDHGRVLGQLRCDVLPNDTVETLAARVFELEKTLYPRVLSHLFETGARSR
jgi:phosphoribosylglycinamide formyltransferase-1